MNGPPLDVRIVSGAPDDAELAAVCAVLAALLGAPPSAAPPAPRPAHWLRGDVHVAPAACTVGRDAT